MIQKIKNKLLILGTLLALALPVAMPTAALAATCDAASGDTNCITGGLCKGAQDLTVGEGQKACTDTAAGTGFTDLLKRIVNILSVIIGVIAVIMIIIGGFRYITSGGKQESVTSAKNTILYAIIGLVIVALAQIIVRFVLSNSTNLAS
jgi:hypothetical protein